MTTSHLPSALPGACRPACGPVCDRDEIVPAIACTLGAGDFRRRIEDIRALAARSLRRSERTALTLRLTYDREALAEVGGLVAKEADCCAFLDFDLRHDATGVHLTVTAPAVAAEAADELFSHFAPGVVRGAV